MREEIELKKEDLTQTPTFAAIPDVALWNSLVLWNPHADMHMHLKTPSVYFYRLTAPAEEISRQSYVPVCSVVSNSLRPQGL